MEEQNQQQETEQAVQEETAAVVVEHVSPFLVGRVDFSGSGLALPDDTMICLKPVAKYDPNEPGLARPDYDNKVLVQDVIESYKEQTGLAYAMRQINAGRLHPFQLNDNGKKGVDLSVLPDNVNEAHALAGSASAAAQRVAAQLGLDAVDPSKIEKLVTDAINKKIAELSVKNEGTEK